MLSVCRASGNNCIRGKTFRRFPASAIPDFVYALVFNRQQHLCDVNIMVYFGKSNDLQSLLFEAYKCRISYSVNNIFAHPSGYVSSVLPANFTKVQSAALDFFSLHNHSALSPIPKSIGFGHSSAIGSKFYFSLTTILWVTYNRNFGLIKIQLLLLAAYVHNNASAEYTMPKTEKGKTAGRYSLEFADCSFDETISLKPTVPGSANGNDQQRDVRDKLFPMLTCSNLNYLPTYFF